RILIFSITNGGLRHARIAGAMPGHAAQRSRLERDHNADETSFAGTRLEKKGSVDETNALLNSQQPQPLAGMRPGAIDVRLATAGSVVTHLEANAARHPDQGGPHLGGLGVSDDVGQAFLGDTINDSFLLVVEFFGERIRPERDPQPRSPRHTFQTR